MRQPNRIQVYAALSIPLALSVLGLKYVAFLVTGSVALYSDAIESIINVVTAFAALGAVWISAKPADANHPYGHSKVEYFSAVLEGVLIIVASLLILREAWRGFHHPRPLDAPLLGLTVNGMATALNAVWSWVLISRGRRLRSPALLADGRHLLSDLYTSVGVIAGVILVAVTGWRMLDSTIAALVAVNVLWSGWGVIQESTAGLMDHALPDNELEQVQSTIAAEMLGALEAHDVRTRQAGRVTFIDFHLVVGETMTVLASHAICDRIENALTAKFPDSVISIHVEPPHKQKDSGGVLLMSDEP
ncbi:cation diffusion facilitator family transporter [Caulobacter sp. S45]|uniref:cation diffusion facilitator family transporter n=1 Tax=Caulobacter sp. S45 TaxID=1641861 RepID=UPI001574FABC|nr:cation diffusion facilitator family transporter [Caulobacter sp. S45]